MIHEIAPHVMHNEFRIQSPAPADLLIYTEGSKTLLRSGAGDSCSIPRFSDLRADGVPVPNSHYLFSIDGTGVFLAESRPEAPETLYAMRPDRTFRGFADLSLAFAGTTAAHIARWERLNRYCGVCGTPMEHSRIERAFICPHCGNTVYPKISPVVIVAVSDGDRLLMARNLNNPDPKRYLVSGFVDVGESLEQAVAREVKEETGVSVKNIRYVTSQPWGFSDSLIAGFTAELDGSPEIRVQKSELSEAVWVSRGEIPEYTGRISVSGVLIERFRRGVGDAV